jgi:Zn-dependent protease
MFESMDFTAIAIIFAVLVVSITIHEMMHAFTSFWLGDDTAAQEGRISFNPLRHVDPLLTIGLPLLTIVLFSVPLLAAKPVPFNPARVKWDEFGAALVGIVGPFTNLLLAIAGAGIIALAGGGFGNETLNLFALYFVAINVGLFIFNMMPIPPLDGSRLVYAFAPESVQRVMASLEQFGIMIVFGLVLFFSPFTDLLRELNSSLLNFLL